MSSNIDKTNIKSKENLTISSAELIIKVKSMISAFESKQLRFTFPNQLSKDDTPIEQYLKASNIIHGANLSNEEFQTIHGMMERLTEYEQIILCGIKSTPEQYAHAVNDYYRVISQLMRADIVKGSFTIISDKERLDGFEKRLDGFETKLNGFEKYLKKITDDLGI